MHTHTQHTHTHTHARAHTCDLRELKTVRKKLMSWSNMSGWVRKTGRREMSTSMCPLKDLNRRFLGLGRSSLMADTMSSSSSRLHFRLGRAGERRERARGGGGQGAELVR